MMKKNNCKKGFTLIELLVAIAIVGILTGLSLVGFGATRKSARDGKRKADLEQIRSALEIYRSDCKTYPNTLSILSDEDLSCTETIYMQSVPVDPSDPDRVYSYIGSTNTYVLCASLEIGGDPSVTGCDCGGFDCNYKLINP